ncbi:MAG: SufE family protein [Paludibacteraceae bacterium]|nr:SufE family protein [Paludibacteraceae bacterium]
MNIEERQEEVIEEFSLYDDWMDRYQYLVELGNALPEMPEADKTEQNLIEGCQSKVWLTAQYNNGVMTYQGDSDAIIVKGIVSLLIKVLSGSTADEIIQSDLHFIDAIGLKEHLSPTRSNGLSAMVKQMRLYAIAYKAKNE